MLHLRAQTRGLHYKTEGSLFWEEGKVIFCTQHEESFLPYSEEEEKMERKKKWKRTGSEIRKLRAFTQLYVWCQSQKNNNSWRQELLHSWTAGAERVKNGRLKQFKSELRSCVKVEVAVLSSPPLMIKPSFWRRRLQTAKPRQQRRYASETCAESAPEAVHCRMHETCAESAPKAVHRRMHETCAESAPEAVHRRMPANSRPILYYNRCRYWTLKKRLCNSTGRLLLCQVSLWAVPVGGGGGGGGMEGGAGGEGEERPIGGDGNGLPWDRQVVGSNLGSGSNFSSTLSPTLFSLWEVDRVSSPLDQPAR